VKNRFQSLPFKCNLQRYIEAREWKRLPLPLAGSVGLYTLSPVDP
jgi:hypothetical protein